MSAKTRELTWANVDIKAAPELAEFDKQELELARARAHAAVKNLQRKGILDAKGRRVRKDLPPEMREESKTGFGG